MIGLLLGIVAAIGVRHIVVSLVVIPEVVAAATTPGAVVVFPHGIICVINRVVGNITYDGKQNR